MRFVLILIGCLLAPAAAAASQGPKPPANDDCLACHSDETAKRANGTSIAVAADVFGKSIHAGLSCVDCHADLAKIVEFPHPEKLQKVSCATCHTDTVKLVEQSIHYAAEKGGKGAHCANCHGTHDILPSTDLASRTFALNLPKTCAQCHSQQHLPGNAGTIGDHYLDSVHGRGVARSGLVVSANCTSCHGAHDIKAKGDPASHVHRANIVGTCSKCHQGIQAVFARSVHAQPATNGKKAPVCSDCHTSHQIQRADTDQWRLAAIQECGTCHLDKIATYRDTFHGQVTALGFTRVATCSDCHGSHDIQGLKNASSSVAPKNLVTMCRKCHAQANENFVKYDPHADKHDRARSPELYWSYKFMQFLLAGVFLAFGVHTLVWFPRSYRARREHDESNGAPS